ncbi:TPA: hypothetical protein ACJGX5_003833 [Salmonella enterica subsp. enterica serovar Senftenberg]|nr:hypothetical protein [Salmonella enterica]HEC8457747.1 hypothetical protein [Salmonella enterica subsp. enterica serovar Poona]
MDTRKITVTQEWQQLTDGHENTFIQFEGGIELCRSATKPDKDAPALRFSNTTLTLTPPDTVWIRTFWQSGDVIVCIW